MRRALGLIAILLALAAGIAARAHAVLSLGDVAPAWGKNQLAGPPWSTGPRDTLPNYPGKVLVYFLLGNT